VHADAITIHVGSEADLVDDLEIIDSLLGVIATEEYWAAMLAQHCTLTKQLAIDAYVNMMNTSFTDAQTAKDNCEAHRNDCSNYTSTAAQVASNVLA
jgi:hypothetical protein